MTRSREVAADVALLGAHNPLSYLFEAAAVGARCMRRKARYQGPSRTGAYLGLRDRSTLVLGGIFNKE
jgi:hypothetical protein